MRKPELVGPHVETRCLWRVRWPDGTLSDLTNLSRAKDAIASYYESRGRTKKQKSKRERADA